MAFDALFKQMVLPPFSLLILLLFICLFLHWAPRLGRGLLWLFLLVFYAMSTPLVAANLLFSLQWYPPLIEEKAVPGAGAIVVFAASASYDVPEYRDPKAPTETVDTAAGLTLQRLQYAAHLSRQTGLPILVAGGGPFSPERSVAQAMKRVLEDDFGVPVRWTEDTSTSTMENAFNAHQILEAEGIDKVYLVTHAWHMPRVVLASKAAGFDVLPAPTRFATLPVPFWDYLMPSMGAFSATYYGLYEWIGLYYYRYRYGTEF